MNREQELVKNLPELIILGQVGSKAYGTNTPESDDDFMGVAIAPLSCYLGLDKYHNDGSLEFKRNDGEDFDAVVYDIKKFLKLCVGFNPNVIPLLYLREEDYRILTPIGKKIVDNRKLFESHRALDTFVGYAKGQLSSVKRGVTGKYGEKRKALIKQYGYDVKFAYHTIRLLGMIRHFFSHGEMNVYRYGDIPKLMDIRMGYWSQEKFFENAEFLMNEITCLFEDAKLWLPEKPNMAAINNLCEECIGEYYDLDL